MDNRIKYLILLIVAFSAHIASAQVLPPPTFSDEPATLRLITENLEDAKTTKVNQQAVAISNLQFLSVYYRTFYVDNGYPGKKLERVSHSKGHSVYEVNMEMGMPAEITLDIRPLGEIPLIMVPGKTTTITYNGKKDTFKCEGPFSQLNEELIRYIGRKGKYRYETMFDIDNGWDKLIEKMNPEEASRFFYDKYKSAESEMNADKKISAEFKEWWRCYIAYNAPCFISDYKFFYEQKTGKAQDHSSYYTWSGVNPVEGNAVFYISRRMCVNDVCRIYQREQGKEPVKNEYVKRLCKAETIKSGIGFQEILTESKIKSYCKDIPEYESALINYLKKENVEKEKQRNRPLKGTLKELDRSLEGDAIIKGILANYNNGKPTIMLISEYCIFKAQHYLAYYKDKFNFVFITGGKFSTQENFQESMQEYEGDFYYLMQYQFNYLNNIYNPYHYCIHIVFDAQGNMIWNPEVGTTDVWSEKLDKYLSEQESKSY